MACDHFPLVDKLDLPPATRDHYCRATHPSYLHYLIYRRDIEAKAAGRAMTREVPCGSPPVHEITAVEPAPATVSAGPRGLDAATIRAKFARHKVLVERVEQCPDRGEQIQGVDGCGCIRTWRCRAGRGTFQSNPEEVSFDECLACVASAAESG